MEFTETEQTETARLVELILWIESERVEWRKRNVDVLEFRGQIIHKETDGQGHLFRTVYIGSISDCQKAEPHPRDFVALVVGGYMGIEHSKLLIENAVDQVAGR